MARQLGGEARRYLAARRAGEEPDATVDRQVERLDVGALAVAVERLERRDAHVELRAASAVVVPRERGERVARNLAATSVVVKGLGNQNRWSVRRVAGSLSASQRQRGSTPRSLAANARACV